MTTPSFFGAILGSRAFFVFARVVFTFVFWGAGLGKIVDYSGTLAELAHFGLNPPGVWAPLVIATLLVGAGLIIVNRYAWLGCGMLATFVVLTIPIAHPFWKLPEPEATYHFHFFAEHITVIGALMMAAILCYREEPARAAAQVRREKQLHVA
ncbi:DoxX family protein [Azorhizobium doebereinerae]|uniref:DoxX family protein n=1 Tax=Azorhizobium doebereinerae TaxID=281091 RepID=UPI00041104A9|nr:DoxX family protein [Azorhizobium doebereinerae]